MGWLDQLKEFGNKVYTPVNKFGSDVYSGLNETYNALDKATKGYLPYGVEPIQTPQRMAGEVIEKFIGDNNQHPNPHHGVRRGPEPMRQNVESEEAGGTGIDHPMAYGVRNDEARVVQTPITDKEIYETVDQNEALRTRGSERYSLADENSPITKYIDEVPDQGYFPVPITGINASAEAIGTAIKSRLGPFGKPFRILRSPETSEKLQRQIDGATIVNNDYINFNENSPNWEQDRFSSNLGGHGIHGRFRGRVGPDNKVVAEDDAYDTMPLEWHTQQFTNHWNEGNLPGMIESGLMNIPFAALEGFANKYPRGREPVIGEISPGHPLYRPQ